MAEILVVDDKPEVRRLFVKMLEAEGYEVRTAANGDKALEAIYVRKPDLILLDLDMPRRNGCSTCEEIRKFDRLLPVIFLTAYDSEANELRARATGGDDFFSKDAAEAVVLASVRRMLARAQAVAEETKSVSETTISLGKVVVDTRTLDVFVDGRRGERLTKTESDILKTLNTRRGINHSVDQLIKVLRGEGFACVDEMLYMHVSNLRRKLGPAAERIVSVRGEGYHLSD